MKVQLDSDDYKSHQRVWLYVDIELDADGHVFAGSAPDGFTPLRVEIDPIEGLSAGDAEWPPATPFRVAGIGEDSAVHEGRVRGAVPLRFFMPRGTGDLTVTGRVWLQVCTATTCDMPGSVEFVLPIAKGRLVRPKS